MKKKRSLRKTKPGDKSRKANRPKQQSATRTLKRAETWIYAVHRIIRKQSDSRKFTGSQALAEARAYFDKVKADPFVDSACIKKREVNGKTVVVEKYQRPLKTRSLPPCSACGRERGTVDEKHPDFQTDPKEDCWDCRSPRGKVAEIAIEIETAGRYDSAKFKPARFPDWPSIAHQAGERFGHHLTDAQLLECIKNWYIAENGGDINSLLGMKLVELAELLKADTGGKGTDTKPTGKAPESDSRTRPRRKYKLDRDNLEEVCEKFPQLSVSNKKAPRNYVTKPEAEQIAKEKYEQLWRIDNQSKWAREIGCDRTTVPKLAAWHRAEKRRQNWRRLANKLEGTVDPAIIEAVHTGDASVLASLSEKEQDNLDGLSDANRAEMIELLNEAARDDDY